MELSRATAHGVVAGIVSELQSGNFRAGFLSGSVSSLAGSGIGQIGGRSLGAITARTTAAAVAGGFSAELGGGKFRNGAVSGAFVHLFNDEVLIKGSIRPPRWLGKIIYGDDYLGQGASLGVGLTYPGFNGGELDLGMFVQAHGGGEDIGTGVISFGVGYTNDRSFDEFDSLSVDASFNDGVGGLSLTFDGATNNLKGVGVHVGPGFNIGYSATLGATYSVRDAARDIRNTFRQFRSGNPRAP